MFAIQQNGNAVIFKVRVQPRASRDELAGLFQDALRIRLTAPPVEGKANGAVCTFLAEKLGIPRSSVEVIQGHSSRNKLVRVTGITRDQVLALLK